MSQKHARTTLNLLLLLLRHSSRVLIREYVCAVGRLDEVVHATVDLLLVIDAALLVELLLLLSTVVT